MGESLTYREPGNTSNLSNMGNIGNMGNMAHMDKKREGNTKLIWLTLMCVISILMLLASLQIILHLLVLVYPAFMSVKAVQSKCRETEKRWLAYWLVYSI